MSKSQRFILLTVVFLVAIGFGIRGIIQQQHARQVIKECMAAEEALEKSPPGFDRADAFVEHIRAIDTTGAPADLAKALHDYADIMERGIIATRYGTNSQKLDDEAAAAKARFVVAVKRYLQ